MQKKPKSNRGRRKSDASESASGPSATSRPPLRRTGSDPAPTARSGQPTSAQRPTLSRRTSEGSLPRRTSEGSALRRSAITPRSSSDGTAGSQRAPTVGKTKRTAEARRGGPRQNVERDAPERARIDITKLKDPAVRREAARLAERAGKFQTGLEIAQAGGIKLLAGMSVEAELQKIFELADANGDVTMLRQLTAATSFSGKLSLFQPTSEAGRAQVRLTQLYNATRGDGSYASIRNNIAALAGDAKTLREMARDAALLSGLDNAQYVDANRLLRTVGGTPARQISDTTREWHLEQATLMKAYRELGGRDAATQKKLALAMLQSFAKAAPLGAAKAEELGAQVSPLLNLPGFYHRSAAANPLLDTVLAAYCKDMGLPMGHAHLVDNPTFREVLAREYGQPGLNTSIASRADYGRALQDLFAMARRGEFPDKQVVLDVTALFQGSGLAPNAIGQLATDLERTFLDEAERFLQANPTVDRQQFGEMMQRLQIGALANHKGVDMLLTPPFLFRSATGEDSPLQADLLDKAKPKSTNVHMEFFSSVEHSMIHSGYRLDPIQARKAWLEVEPPDAILAKYGIQLTELATANKPTPKVFDSFAAFTAHPTFQRFEALANAPNAPPYLKTLPKATAAMLRGMAAINPGAGGIDKAMGDQGLDEVLQTAYFRMLNAMASAVQSQGDLMGFMNQTELLQQEIATLLTLVEPHAANTFGDSVRARLSAPTGPGGRPVIPAGLNRPGVVLKPSAMHCLASVLAGVEAVKGSNALNVAVVKDHYYESAGAVQTSGTYSTSELNGDALRGPDGAPRPLDPASIKGNRPLDLYVCDFHHNISLDRNHYQLENLQHHVDQLFDKGLVAQQFTVAIDCTIDFVNSPDVQAFLAHNKDRIEAGELNVVLFRSAQKFDMLGMDNYYGGFAVNINSHTHFADFNRRMEAPEDQLKGPSLQGLAHIAAHAGEDTDAYRNALMASTKRFYDALPAGLIWSEGSSSAMQVAKSDDPNAVFLDIKFPGNEQASAAFMDRLKQFAADEGLPLTGRASFGFATTNLNLIHGEKTRLTPGLEGPQVQDRYIAFFKAVHSRANDAVRTGTTLGLNGDALKQHVAAQIATISLSRLG